MPDGEAPVSATRGALLELKEERRLMQESYDFLDEKRILLAQAILAELSRYQALRAEFEAAREEAAQALKAALRRHGLQGLNVYPAPAPEGSPVKLSERIFLGLAMVEAQPVFDSVEPPPTTHPSPEGNLCRARARSLLAAMPALAACSRNITVLCAEYTRTERRARALENILLPDIEVDLVLIEEQLEAIEQEEVLRVRNASER